MNFINNKSHFFIFQWITKPRHYSVVWKLISYTLAVKTQSLQHWKENSISYWMGFCFSVSDFSHNTSNMFCLEGRFKTCTFHFGVLEQNMNSILPNVTYVLIYCSLVYTAVVWNFWLVVRNSVYKFRWEFGIKFIKIKWLFKKQYFLVIFGVSVCVNISYYLCKHMNAVIFL